MGERGLHQNKGGRREKGHGRYKKKSLLLFMLNLVKTRLKKKQRVEHSQQNLNPTKLKKAGNNKKHLLSRSIDKLRKCVWRARKTHASRKLIPLLFSSVQHPK